MEKLLEIVNKKKDELIKKNLAAKKEFEKISASVDKKSFTFHQESKENGDLYGSIKPKQISTLIKEKTKIEVTPSQIILKDELNKIGSFNAMINFHPDVKASIIIKIEKIKSN